MVTWHTHTHTHNMDWHKTILRIVTERHQWCVKSYHFWQLCVEFKSALCSNFFRSFGLRERSWREWSRKVMENWRLKDSSKRRNSNTFLPSLLQLKFQLGHLNRKLLSMGEMSRCKLPGASKVSFSPLKETRIPGNTYVYLQKEKAKTTMGCAT